MLNIYGHFLSMPSNKVRLCVSYLQLPHEYHHVDMQNDAHKSADYLAMNPAGRVPALRDGDFNLSQSDTMCKYMCALAGPSDFWPADLQTLAKISEWNDFCVHHVMPGMGRIFINRVIAPMLGGEADAASIQAGLDMHAKNFPVLDTQLGKNTYVCGDKITLADISLLAGLEPAEMCKFDLSPYKNIMRWRDEVTKLDFYQSVHARFAAEMTS